MSLLARLLPQRPPATNADPRVGLDAAAEWLARAQDATGTGGVAANYDASKQQWAGAYPETTGYIIETLLHYADYAGKPEYRERALRMAAWESDIQLRDGGVRAGTLDAKEIVPTIFNTGQVLFGWAAAWQATHDMRFRDSLVRAADWLVAAQDDDGAWRKFASPFAAHTLNTYNTRVAFGLVVAGKALGTYPSRSDATASLPVIPAQAGIQIEGTDIKMDSGLCRDDRNSASPRVPNYMDAAVRNVGWALTQMHANGWLENNDLEDNAKPLTHTIAYATRGILEVGVATGNQRFVDAAANIARAVAQTQRSDGALPGRLDANWRPAAKWTCVTGNAQMAIVWQRLARETGDAGWQPHADRAIDFSLSVQDTAHANPAIRGALPGSHPRSGGYMRHRYPNWAAKFVMDAILLQLEAG